MYLQFKGLSPFSFLFFIKKKKKEKAKSFTKSSEGRPEVKEYVVENQ